MLRATQSGVISRAEPSPFEAQGPWLASAGIMPTYCDELVSKHVLLVDAGGGERTVAAVVGAKLLFFRISQCAAGGLTAFPL